jgi:plastocyanin
MINILKLPIRLRRRTLLFSLLLLFVALSSSPAVAQSGTVEGLITYQADPARPWRYARYYVKQAKTGELAETVVAIRAKPAVENDRQPQTVVVDQHNFQFTPETVVIRRGDSVKFTNADQSTHNVQSSSEIATFNANMPGGGEQVVRFDRAGGIRQPVTVGCVFHSAMRAYIFVFDHPWYQLTAADGRFRLADVPPGEYELEIAHPAGELRTRKRITVKAGEVTQIDIRLSPDDKR